MGSYTKWLIVVWWRVKREWFTIFTHYCKKQNNKIQVSYDWESLLREKRLEFKFGTPLSVLWFILTLLREGGSIFVMNVSNFSLWIFRTKTFRWFLSKEKFQNIFCYICVSKYYEQNNNSNSFQIKMKNIYIFEFIQILFQTLALSQLRIRSFDPTFMKDAQCAETNEK